MRRLALLLEYDGAEFAGWQRQHGGARTVQGALEATLSKLAAAPTRTIAAGRTDAGVHAWGQVASTSVATDLDAAELWRALNALLPRDLAVRALATVPEGFHALRDAVGKHYVYRWWVGSVRSPLHARTHHRVGRRLDVESMRAAAKHFVGVRDFACLQAAGSPTASTVRTLSRVELSEEAAGCLRLDVEGDGFLRHMVRNLAGTLGEVGAGLRAPESMPSLLESRDRARAGATAPAQGLMLLSVRYQPAIPWEAGAPGLGEAPRGMLP